MNIIILGAGRVGESVAESLVSEKNDITVIDTDPQRLHRLQDRLDLRCVVGNGIQPSVLEQAGIRDADMLIGCAAADETNLVACKIAHDLFSVSTTIARLRSPEFVTGSRLMDKPGFAVDEVICPEAAVTAMVSKLISYPQALQVLEFAHGLVSLIVVRALPAGLLSQRRLADIPGLLPGLGLRVVAIYRQEAMLPDLDGETRIEADDEVFVLAATERIREVLFALHPANQNPVRRVMVAGGGNVGLRLARAIEGRYQVKLVESDRRRCDTIATQVSSATLVLHGDCTDEDLLEDENVRDIDLFAALTNDDEDNIMSCLLAKRMGAKRVLALINRKAYANLVQGTQIDIAISPAQAVIGGLLAHVRRGDIEAVHSLRRGASEALEAIVHGDRKSSRMAGRRVGELKLPPGVQIGAIVRGLHLPDGAPAGDDARPQILMAHHDREIEPLDHVIVFVPRKRMLREVEKLFQVSATFF
jgi:trk system potassium uptake protein TrkA